MPRVVMAAIRTPDRTARPLLRKAASLAKAHRAQLHLVHVIDIPPDPLQSAGAEVRRAALSLLLDRRQALGKLAQRAELRAVRAISHVSWDYPASDGLVREALRRRPRLLVAESYRHGRLARALPANTDCELIRNSPCPLWLSKSSAPLPARGRVLAAFDPMHSHAKPAGLDHIILQSAVDAAGGDRKRVLAFHACNAPRPLAVGGDAVVEAFGLSLSDAEREAYMQEARRKVNAEAARLDIPQENVIVRAGDPCLSYRVCQRNMRRRLSRWARSRAAASTVCS